MLAWMAEVSDIEIASGSGSRCLMRFWSGCWPSLRSSRGLTGAGEVISKLLRVVIGRPAVGRRLRLLAVWAPS